MTAKLSLFGLLALVLFAGGTFVLQLFSTPPRTVDAKLEPYGDVQVHLQTEPDSPKPGAIPLMIHLTDSNGNPVSVDQVRYEYGEKGKALQAAEGETTGTGSYSVLAPINSVGEWQVNVTLVKGGQQAQVKFSLRCDAEHLDRLIDQEKDMQGKAILLGAVLVISGLASAACSSTSAAAPNLPQASSEQSILATAPAFNTTETAKEPTTGASAETDGSGYQSQVVEGGSVTVEVLPVTLRAGSPAEFELSMNTHSVDLSTDLLKSVVLRDDTGKEYAPTKWDGPSGGGHHRSGKIDFPALSTDAKSITLIVKDIAKVPERTFKWDVQP